MSIAKRYHFCLWNFGTFLLIWKFCHLFSLHLKNKNKRNIQIRNKLLFILCLMTHYITILGFNYYHLFLFGQRSLIHYRNSQIRNQLLFIIYSMTLFITMLGSNYRHLCLFFGNNLMHSIIHRKKPRIRQIRWPKVFVAEWSKSHSFKMYLKSVHWQN